MMAAVDASDAPLSPTTESSVNSEVTTYSCPPSSSAPDEGSSRPDADEGDYEQPFRYHLRTCAVIMIRRTLIITAAITWASVFSLTLEASLPYAWVMLVVGHVIPPLLPPTRRSVVLEVLAELNGWAWVTVAIVLMHQHETAGAKAECAVGISAACLAYVVLMPRARMYLKWNAHLHEHMLDFESDAVGYCLGALGHSILFMGGDCKEETEILCEDNDENANTADWIGIALICLAAWLIRKSEQHDFSGSPIISTIMRATAVFTAFNLVRFFADYTWLVDPHDEEHYNATQLVALFGLAVGFLVMLWLAMTFVLRGMTMGSRKYALLVRGADGDPVKLARMNKRFKAKRLRRKIWIMAIAVAAGLAVETYFERLFESVTHTHKVRYILATCGLVVVVAVELLIPKHVVEELNDEIDGRPSEQDFPELPVHLGTALDDELAPCTPEDPGFPPAHPCDLPGVSDGGSAISATSSSHQSHRKGPLQQYAKLPDGGLGDPLLQRQTM